MDSRRFDRRGRRLPKAIKIVIAGGFGVGKTTLVGAVSEIKPLRTEEVLTDTSVGVDDVAGVEAKATTTVAMDFGRITISDELVLYLFGTPGQERFWFMWDELATARSARSCSPTPGGSPTASRRRLLRARGTPFIVAVNCFEGSRRFELDEVEMALNLGPHVPVTLCDARDKESCKDVLVALVQHAMKTRKQARTATV